MNIIIVKSSITQKYRAYFEPFPRLYGEADTKEHAIKELVNKMYAILRAVGEIQEHME